VLATVCPAPAETPRYGAMRTSRTLLTALLIGALHGGVLATPTHAHDAPPPSGPTPRWAVSLHPRRGADLTCSGVLISPVHVVTAAHCVMDRPQVLPQVRFVAPDGSHTWRRTTTATVHPDFAVLRAAGPRRTHVVHDVAMLRLATPVRLAAYPRVAAGTTRGAGTFYGFSPERAQVNQPVTTLTSRAEEWFDHVDRRIHIVAGDPRGGVLRASCGGDSGGGLITWTAGGPVLTGVVSYGVVRCGEDGPSVFTRIAAHRGWIRTVSEPAP